MDRESPPSTRARFRPEALFKPQRIALLGADSEIGGQILTNLAAGGFQGEIYQVGRAVPLPNLAAFPDLASLPVAPDLAILALAPEEIDAALAGLAARGTFAAIVPGPMPQLDLGAMARARGVRVLGPNAFGIAVPAIGLNATRAHLPPRPGRMAVVVQSGALARAIMDWAEPNGVGFSHIVGIGGNADIGFGLVLDWLSRDPGTGLILLALRRIRNRRAFLSAARAAARLRPVVALREGGRLADPSGMADGAMEAALRRAGILPLSGLEDVLAAAETLTRAKPVRGEALAIAANAIGLGRLAADAALRSGLALAKFAHATQAALHLTLRGQAEEMDVPESGPVYVNPGAPIRLAEVTSVLAGAEEVGGVLALHAPVGFADAAELAALAATVQASRAPVLVCVMGETTGAEHRKALASANAPVFATPEQAVRGFLHLVQHRRSRAAARELPSSQVLHIAPDREQVAALFREARAQGRTALREDEALVVLAAYGIPVVPTRRAEAAEDAAAAAGVLGFPVVLKGCRPDYRSFAPIHLDLPDPAAVQAAAQAMLGADESRPQGLLVQRQVARARQLMICLQEDAMFGPVIGFGLGGSVAMALQDLALDLPPLNLPLARALMARSRAARLLALPNGQMAPSAEAVAEALVRISQLIVDFPEIADLVIDPLFVDFTGVLAADAWLRLRPPGERAYLAIPPYPENLIRHCEIGGERLVIRPIRPEDAEAHAAFFKRLSPEDVRYRFFTSLRELPPEMMARLTQIDYEREMAFIAVREETGETIGVARLVREPATAEAEFAVVVQPDAKGKGVATRLMQEVLDWAKSQGVQEVYGEILAENAPMLGFVRHLGFTLRHLPGQEDVLEARLLLGERA
jgi:acetyltransferase